MGQTLTQVLGNHWIKQRLAAKNIYIDSSDPFQDPQSDLKDLEFHSRSKMTYVLKPEVVGTVSPKRVPFYRMNQLVTVAIENLHPPST